jgi:transcriptional regulator with XRE-family HTH domain
LKKNWTQEQLGNCLGVSAQAVSKWEKGDSLPDISILPSMAKELGFTIDYLLGSKSTLMHLLPQIEAGLPKLKEEDKIDFLGQILFSFRPRNYRQPKDREKDDTPYLSLDYRSVTWWVKQRAVMIATEPYLQQSKAALEKDTDFPLNIIPADLLKLLAALIPDKLANPKGHAIPESELRAVLPDNFDFHGAMEPCIELGFVERIRGGYKLNLKANFAMRMLSLMNFVLHGSIGTSVSYPSTSNE